MKRHRHQRFASLARRLRGVRPDRNPLRRRCDRLEATVVAGLLAVFLAGAPVAALAAWHGAYSANLRIERTETAARHQVTAVLLHDAPRPFYAYGAVLPPQVKAEWLAPDGTPRTGMITAGAGTPAGTSVTVWEDASGRLHSPPLTHAKATGRAVLATIFTPIGLALVLLGTAMTTHWLLERRRLAAWEAEWSRTEPQWTSRRHGGAPS